MYAFASRWSWLGAASLAFGCSSAANTPRPFEVGAGGQAGAVVTGAGGASGSSGGGAGPAGQGGSLLTIVDASSGSAAFITDGALPEGFTSSTLGGYQLGAALSGPDAGMLAPITSCNSVLIGVVRDFPAAHPDFGHYCCGDMRGVVAPALGDDQKPVYTLPGPYTIPNSTTQLSTGPTQFDQWYRTVDGVNLPYLVYLFFVPNAGVFTFQSNSFFPLDNVGFGNEYLDHNYGFTTELHTAFKYNGGETFMFTGDDDLWVFINHQLAIDLGGVHQAESQLVTLDAKAADLGLTTGNVYPVDLFQAERHPTSSNFRVDTNLQFVNCGVIVSDVR
jgi:fibro-slime domain-containing protein